YPYLEEHADAWLSVVAGKDGVMDFAIASESETIGGIGLVPKDDVHRKSVELGYWLAEPFWGKGIMTSAVGNITSYAFDTLDIVRIYSTIFEWNHASMKVLEKVGFIREGHLRKSAFKDGHLIDQFVYALILQKAK
ncbi:GNAT family N-acetyltransferase, partial [bacterium]|nr:GNAT family N-acetyltransferase [bacterium]